MENLFKTSNFSSIIWKDGVRKGINFERASGLLVDIDNDMTIDDAKTILKEHNWNYAMITSKSHTPKVHKVHIYLPLDEPIKDVELYKSSQIYIIHHVFKGSDKAVKDPARFFFGSKEDSEYYAYWNGEYIKPQAGYEVPDNKPKKQKKKSESKQSKKPSKKVNLKPNPTFKDDLVVENDQGQFLTVGNINEKTVIKCPFHADNNPSAFIDFSERQNNWYIHCSSCNKTFWKEFKVDENKLLPFFSYNTDVYEAGMSGDEFAFQKIGEKKFAIKCDAITKEAKDKYYRTLVKRKHIHHLSSINKVGDIVAKESY